MYFCFSPYMGKSEKILGRNSCPKLTLGKEKPFQDDPFCPAKIEEAFLLTATDTDPYKALPQIHHI